MVEGALAFPLDKSNPPLTTPMNILGMNNAFIYFAYLYFLRIY